MALLRKKRPLNQSGRKVTIQEVLGPSLFAKLLPDFHCSLIQRF